MSELQEKQVDINRLLNLVNTQGVEKTAKELNLSRTTIWRLLKKAGYKNAWVKHSGLS